MSIDLVKSLEEMKGCWMIGGSAMEKAPAAWRSAAESDSSPDSALIALAGQAMQFALHMAPGGDLKPLPALPRLRFPTPPLQARQQIRVLCRIVKLNESQLQSVIHLLAARGYVVHPADYMPKSFDQLPDAYSPWELWHRSEVIAEAGKHDVITAENWSDWLPAERRAALAQLRRRDPQAARELIAEQTPALPAEERVKIMEMCGIDLVEEDRSLLESFVSDRSTKVKRLVEQYLARIGAVEGDAAEVAEYVEFFSVAKKLLRSGSTIKANPLKTDAQRKRRNELAAKLSLQSFVKGLQLESEIALISGWENVDEAASDELMRMVAATGSPQAVSALASRITSLGGITAEAFRLLFERLSKEGRRELLPRVLANSDPTFAAAIVCSQGLLGEVPFEQLKSLPVLKRLKALAGEEHSNDQASQFMLRQGLFSLGLLADHAAAVELIKLFTDSRLFAADPMLGILKLNACLPPGEPL
jgi:Family of unknown function (DUF5691)